MKNVASALLNHLLTSDEFQFCDLYELTLENGNVYRYAQYDRDVTCDGKIYSSTGPIFKRNRIKLSGSITVDKLTVTINADANDKVEDVPLLEMAHNGGLDNSRLTILRPFFNADGSIAGTVMLFSGYVDIKDGGGLELALEVKSSVQLLNVDYPLRKYYPTCPWNLYGAGCALNKESWAAYGTVTAVTDAQTFRCNLSYATGYYDQGIIEWLTGSNARVTASVKRSMTNGSLSMLMPLESVPVVGDTFRIYPGCDKTATTCKNKFNNASHYRGTPYVPLKEALI